jgi:hypothetical protein
MINDMCRLVFIVGIVSSSSSLEEIDCSFMSSYPRQYVAYKLTEDIVVDGKINEKMWDEVPFTSDFVDISTTTIPKFTTRAKIRWDDNFLYIAAVLDEPDIWANITSTCHCYDPSTDQVIFHDNDFEIFIDPGRKTNTNPLTEIIHYF